MSDFETVNWANQPTYFCPKHGDQGGFIGMSISLSGNAEQPLPEALKPYEGVRNYCWCCWIDMLDANMERLVRSPQPDTSKGTA